MREPLIGFMVIDDYTEDYSNWSGQIAFPNPIGANLYWLNPIKMIEAEPALARIKELEERLKLLQTQNAEFKDYFQMQHVVRHRR